MGPDRQAALRVRSNKTREVDPASRAELERLGGEIRHEGRERAHQAGREPWHFPAIGLGGPNRML